MQSLKKYTHWAPCQYEQFDKLIYWFSTDSEECYDKNLKFNYNQLHQNGWINKTIEYKLNSHGFRCDEFNTDQKILFLGCSLTFGVGLPLEQTWPWIVANSYKMSYVNLGLPGTSLDTAFRLFYTWISDLNPQIVILREPPGVRWEICTDTEFMHFTSNCETVIDGSLKDYYKYMITYPENFFLNKTKNILALEYLCSKKNIKFIHGSTDGNYIDKYHDLSGLARDLLHPGYQGNRRYADYIIEQINR